MSEPISAFAAHRASLKGTKNSPKSVAKKAEAAAATNGAAKKNAANTSKSKNKAKTSEGNKPKTTTAHLTKAEQRKQRELEAYLQRQLEKDDVAGEDVFSDEYTMNSYSDEYTDDSHCCSRCEPGAAAAQAAPPTPESKKQANKRKSMEAKEVKNNAETNGEAAESKKAKKEAAKIAAEANKKSAEANKKANRKSMDKKETEAADDNAAADAHNKSAHKKHKKHSESLKKEATADSEGYEICGEICERRPKKGKAKAATVAAVAAAVTPVAPPPAESTPVNVCRRKSGVKLEPLSPPSNVTKMNSIDEGLKCFRWLLNPVGVEDFYAKYWERNACLVKRQQDNYFNHLISFEAIDQMLLKNYVEFTKNIDVTSYKNGVRETLNPDGRAMPPVVWEHYGNGCSIRLLNPQTFLPALYTLSTTMQEYFHCLVGANAYLTPPNSQGFAPHYDDIEAFVLQIEGRKRWRLYKPRSKTEELPRVSSRNFKPNEIGKPIFDEVLHPGDILYFPRGTIHQACTEPGFHSLHITLSVYQKQSYADLLEQLMPRMLERAIAASVDMRRGLPLHTWQSAGIAHSECDTQQRHELIDKVTQLLTRSMRAAPVAELLDAAVDQLAKKFQREALPPEVLPSERVRTIFGSTSTTNERGECVCDYDIDLRTNIRLLRANILRLVEEEEKVRIYYYLDNSKEYCEYEPNYIEIDAADAGSVEVLIKSYPQYIGVAQLPLDEDEQKITVATALWERGLLMMEKPFK